MIYDWYKIINRADFEATGLVSRNLSLILDGIGLVTVMVTKGRLYSLVYAGNFLPIGVTEDNPFEMDGFASYLSVDDDIYLGVNGREA